MDHRFPQDAFPTIVAHRGASSTHPENTLPAFEAALELGARAIELDVRLTADGVAVVMHDDEVSRTTDGRGFVHELTAAEVAALDAGTPEAPARVPLLEEVLELLSGRAAVVLEIKNLPGEPSFEPDRESIVGATLAALDRTRFEGPALIVSFNPASIAAARRLAREVATGFLTMDVDPRPALAHAVQAGHDLVLPGAWSLAAAGEEYVREAHAAGVRVGTWTLDDPETVAAFLDLGADAIASNDPGMALAVLAARSA